MSAPVMVELSAEDRLRAWERSCPGRVVSITQSMTTVYDADTKIKAFGRTADEVADTLNIPSQVEVLSIADGPCGVCSAVDGSPNPPLVLCHRCSRPTVCECGRNISGPHSMDATADVVQFWCQECWDETGPEQ